jgi:hypothetical protein
MEKNEKREEEKALAESTFADGDPRSDNQGF